ncbi:MAG: alpha/beta fold hydrolase [Micromonosporaceae bacterium]
MSEPGVTHDLEPAAAAEFESVMVVQTAETAQRFRDEVMAGAERADQTALKRMRRRYALSRSPERETPYPGPTLILTGRQDSIAGYADAYPLLAHYPRATYAVLDRAGHGLQLEAPALFEALVSEWLDRVGDTPA